MRTRAILLLDILAVMAAIGLIFFFGWRYLHKTKDSGIKLTIGPETTHVTGPMDRDGYVDYPAALNERLGQGVTPETNANVLLWKAVGPTPAVSKRMPAQFFELLGTEVPPEKGEYFIRLKDFIRDRLETGDPEVVKPFEEELSRLARDPWSPKDHAHVATWLTANQKPLALVAEASKRPNYFSPIVAGSILESIDPVMSASRELVLALASRAMLEVNDGKPAEAWADLLTCHRLARLLARGGTFAAYVHGVALDLVAGTADVAFLDRAGMSAKQIHGCADDYRALPAISALADRVDVGERFLFLNEMMLFAKHGFWYVEQLAGGKANDLRDEPVPNVNWDPGLHAANQWFDAVVAAMREPDRPTRQAQLERIEGEQKEMKARTTIRQEIAAAVADVDTSPNQKGSLCGEVLLGLTAPAVFKLQEAADRYEQGERNLRVAFALAAYRVDHKSYPRTLNELAPKYLDMIPDDLFTGQPLTYHPIENGYLLYSLGPNGMDDDGRGPGDDPIGDDIAVRVPELSGNTPARGTPGRRVPRPRSAHVPLAGSTGEP
jgi:hypothetical protein